MPRKPCRHRRRHHRQDRGRHRRRLTNRMEENVAKREDDMRTNKRQWRQSSSSSSGGSGSGSGRHHPSLALGLPQLLVRKGQSCACPKKNTKKAIPTLERGLPESVWVGICQYSKSGSPRSGLGFIPIWGQTYLLLTYHKFKDLAQLKSTFPRVDSCHVISNM